MLLLQEMKQWELVGFQACVEIPQRKKNKAIYLHYLPGICNLRQGKEDIRKNRLWLLQDCFSFQ